MDQESIIEARKKAEQAVEGMVDPSLKVKAFEQIFGRLLEGASAERMAKGQARKRPLSSKAADEIVSRPGTLTGRLLALKNDGFFASQRTLSDIREELGSRGFHVPLTTLSGLMQNLVRGRKLRRERTRIGAKKAYKYSNS